MKRGLMLRDFTVVDVDTGEIVVEATDYFLAWTRALRCHYAIIASEMSS